MRVIVGDQLPIIFRADDRCGVPDPEQPTLLCGREPGHDDNHAEVAMSGLVHAVWEPYTEATSPLPDGVKDVLDTVAGLVEDVRDALRSAEGELWDLRIRHKDDELLTELLMMVHLPSEYDVEELHDPDDDASVFQVVKDARTRLEKRKERPA